MIDELRDTMQRQAEALTPKPDPYRRLMLRRTRRRAIVAATVTTLFLSLAVPAGFLLSRNGFLGYAARPGGTPPAELEPILGSSTRGTLAGDTAFLREMRVRAAEEVNRSRQGDPREVYMPTDPDAIRVLFAGDIADCGRIVVLGGVTGRPLQATYIGAVGEPSQALRLAGSGMLSAVAQPAWTGPTGPYQLIFGPERSRLEVSVHTRYLRDGPVTQWRPVDGDVYLAGSVTTPAGTRVRVSGNDFTPAEIAVTAVQAIPPQLATVDEESLRGHGDGIRRAAEQAALMIARRTGLTTAGAKFVLLWGGQVEMRGLSRPAAPVATVLALTPDGGGPFATVAVDPISPYVPPITHPTGDGVIGDPANSLIVQRLPAGAPSGGDAAGPPPESDHLLIIAPPSAVQAKIIQGGTLVERVELHQGVGQIRMSAKLVIVVRALDQTGDFVAEAGFYDVP